MGCRALPLVALLVAGCNELLGIGDVHSGSTSVDGGTDGPPGTPDGPSLHVAARYVVSHVDIPSDSASTMADGLDLDGDSRVDNQVGSVFSAFAAQNILIAFDANTAIAKGDAIWLHAVSATDLTTSPAAQWASYDGTPTATPDFTGNGVFSVDTTAPIDRHVDGAIASSAMSGMSGTGRMVLGCGTGVMHLDLRGAAVKIDVTPTSCSGVIGGGIPDADVNSALLPGLATAAEKAVQADPNCPAACGHPASDLLNLFDTNHDGTITVTEFSGNSLIKSLIAPDLDLVDANGNPGTDGVKDSLSIGVRITCVKGSFASP
jgi:hypothetical protein